MDYIAEFTVTMPILSLNGTSDSLPDGEHVVQVYCVQTQAIQQYALNLSQCLPQPLEIMGLERTGSSVSHVSDSSELSYGNGPGEVPLSSPNPMHTISTGTSFDDSPGVPTGNFSIKSSFEGTDLLDLSPSDVEPKPSVVFSTSTTISPRTSSKSSNFGSPSNSYQPSLPQNEHGNDQLAVDCSVDEGVDAVKEYLAHVPSLGDDDRYEESAVQNEISMISTSEIFKQPTQLITPLEILTKAVSSSNTSHSSPGMTMGEAKIQVVGNDELESWEVEVKIVGETARQINDFNCQRDSDIIVAEKKEKSFFSQVSDLSIRVAREFCEDTSVMDKSQQAKRAIPFAESVRNSAGEKDVQDSAGDSSANVGEKTTLGTVSQSLILGTKGRQQMGKNSHVSGPSSPSRSPCKSTDLSNEPISSSGVPSVGAALSQLWSVQENLDQLTSMHKEMQKQMNAVVSGPVAKEGRRLEASLGRSLEKLVKANSEALWARFQEENAKHDELEQAYAQRITDMITNFANKDLPVMLEKTLKKEIALMGPAVARVVNPVLGKMISSAILEAFQKGVGDRSVNQLEKLVNAKLEATLARQIQTQFQTSGKQVLLDALRSSFEASVIPAFEISCKAMFKQVDTALQKGFAKHTNAAQQQFEAMHCALAVALRESNNSASSITETLNGEPADGQQKVLALTTSGANSKVVNPWVAQLSNGPMVGLLERVLTKTQAEAPFDPTKELARLLSESRYEEAFAAALQRSDVSIISWLCS